MDSRIRQSMNEYYDEHSAEFDEIYTLGKPPSSVSDSDLYMKEVRTLASIVREQYLGNLLDIPCVTGYGLQFYAANSSAITLVDQSGNMLRESFEKALAFDVERSPDSSKPMPLTFHCMIDPMIPCWSDSSSAMSRVDRSFCFFTTSVTYSNLVAACSSWIPYGCVIASPDRRNVQRSAL